MIGLVSRHRSRWDSVLPVLVSLLVTSAIGADDPLTFFATSDSHYEAVQNIERNDRNRATIRRMNALPGTPWPSALGGGEIGRPSGVCVLGDLIDDGDKAGETEAEWRHFEEQFGFDGSDGLLRYPTFEGWGNHDGPPVEFVKHGFSLQSQLRRRNRLRRERGWLSLVSDNGLHYSWDWHGVHFVQTNLYPADKQHPKVRYSLPWHDPQGALTFLKDDLRECVGRSGRPVIVMAHCGFDTDWWVADDWKAFYQAVKGFNLIAYIHGHSGTGVRKWKPEGEDVPLDIVNTGQTEKGFFVVEVGRDRLRLAYQVKRDPKETEHLEWEWKHLLNKPISWSGGAGTTSLRDETGATRTAGRSSDPPSRLRDDPTPNAHGRPDDTSIRFAVIGDFGIDGGRPRPTAAATRPAGEGPPGSTEARPNGALISSPSTSTDLEVRRHPSEAAVARLVAGWKPDFVVTTGDNNYPRGEASTIDDNIGKYYSSFIGDYRGRYGAGAGADANRFFPVLGNHDHDAPKVGARAYLDYFTLPGCERYYEFVNGPVHFFMLDSDGHEPDGVRVDSKQHQWFAKAVAASRSPFQVVVLHHPPYSSGEHGDHRTLQWEFEKYGVDLVLAGHDHDYERIERGGVFHVVNGAGGAPLRQFKSNVPGSLVRYREKHGAMLVEAMRRNGAWRLTSRFINVDEEVIDRFTVRRREETAGGGIEGADHEPPL